METSAIGSKTGILQTTFNAIEHNVVALEARFLKIVKLAQKLTPQPYAPIAKVIRSLLLATMSHAPQQQKAIFSQDPSNRNCF